MQPQYSIPEDENPTEDEQHAAILAKGREMFGVVIRCTHNNVTLVQHTDPDYGWFACYQCDDCGQIARREVTADQLLDGTANDLPWLDVDMYEHVTTERDIYEAALRAHAFFRKAAK